MHHFLSYKSALLFFLSILLLWWTFAIAPSFDKNFANYLTDDTPDKYWRVETVFSLCIDKNLTLMQNIQRLFYPNLVPVDSECGTAWWQLWDLVRWISFVLLFVFLVVAWVNLILNAKDSAATKKAFTSFIYILYGAFLIFGVTWILWSVLNISWLQWSSQLVDRLQNSLFFELLSFFKVLAFFAAILMIVVYGVKMMAAMDKSDKVKVAQKGIVNVIIALVFIKLIDYVFYIAQTPALWQKLSDLIIQVAVILWWILWALFVLALLYAGYMMIVSGGKEDAMKKAKSMVINILVISLVIFLFLLIVYQIFNEFAL